MAAGFSPTMVKELRNRTGVGMSKCKEALEQANGDMELAIANLRKAGMVSAVKREGRETKEGMIASAETEQVVAIVEVNAETDFVVKSEPFQLFTAYIAKEIAKTQSTSVADLLAKPYTADTSITIDQHRALVMQSVGENIQIKRLHVSNKRDNNSIAVYSHMGGKIVALVELEGSNKEQALAYEIAMHIAAEAPEYLNPQDVPAELKLQEEDIAREQAKGRLENVLQKIIEGKLQGFYAQVCLTQQKYVKDPSMSITDVVAKRAKEAGVTLSIKNFVRWQIGL